MDISIDAGHAPQLFPQQQHQAPAHMGMGSMAAAQMLMQMQMQQQQMMAHMAPQPMVAAPLDYRSMLTPYQQKKFDKWYNDSTAENKMTVAHDATRAALHFDVNDDMIKKIAGSYVFIFRDRGGSETKMASNLIKVSKGGFRAELSFDDSSFWERDALVLIWRAAQGTLLTNTKPDAIAPFLNRAKRHRKLTFMLFGSEQPEVECKRSFETVFPWSKRSGSLSFSLSGLLHHAAAADIAKQKGAPLSLPLWKMIGKPPKNWRLVLHPWIIAVLRECSSEDKQKELFEAVGFDLQVEPDWLKKLPDRLEKVLKEIDDADTKCGYGADLPEYESVAELIKTVDRELLASMHKSQMNHWQEERFAVVLAEGGSLLTLDEETKAGVEVLRMDELLEFWKMVLR